jgi:hypothetical protein
LNWNKKVTIVAAAAAGILASCAATAAMPARAADGPSAVVSAVSATTSDGTYLYVTGTYSCRASSGTTIGGGLVLIASQADGGPVDQDGQPLGADAGVTVTCDGTQREWNAKFHNMYYGAKGSWQKSRMVHISGALMAGDESNNDNISSEVVKTAVNTDVMVS